MTATAVSRGTKPALAAAIFAVPTLDDVLLELVDVDDNVRVDIGELEALAASIHELGVLQAIKVTAQPDGRYRLVYGQRRVLACRQLGRTRIAAIIEPPSDVDVHGARRSIEQLSENLQRQDLNPMEEAVALREVLEATKGLTQEALADRLGMSRPWVSNTLGLLDASPAVQAHVREGRLTPSHVKALRGLAAAWRAMPPLDLPDDGARAPEPITPPEPAPEAPVRPSADGGRATRDELQASRKRGQAQMQAQRRAAGPTSAAAAAKAPPTRKGTTGQTRTPEQRERIRQGQLASIARRKAEAVS